MAASRNNPADAISDVGGARCMWFTLVTGSIDIDNQYLAHNVEVADAPSSKDECEQRPRHRDTHRDGAKPMSGPTLQVWFQERCTPALAVQRLSTVLSHQRAPLLDLWVRQDPGAVWAWLHLDTLEPDALEQIIRRLARDWSVVTVETMPPNGDRQIT